MQDHEFAIANVTPGKLNALVKNAMKQTETDDPEEAVRRVNSGEYIIVQCPLLRRLGTVEVTVENFVASEVLSGPGFWVSKEFKKNFFGLPEENSEMIKLRCQKLTRGSRDEGILKDLGPDHVITLGQFVGYLAGADKTKTHIAYIMDANGVLWAVNSSRNSSDSMWGLYVYSVLHLGGWVVGNVVVSRDI